MQSRNLDSESKGSLRVRLAVSRSGCTWVWPWALLAWLLLACGAPAQDADAVLETSGAQEEGPLDRLRRLLGTPITNVFGPSKFWQEISEAPASVTVITADEFKFYGHRTLAEALRTVPGMHVTYDRQYSFLGVRGFNRGDNNSRVLVLVDGHRMNNNLTDGAALGTDFLLDVDLIDHIEVIRGPGSALYGNNAFFGVINVVTRRGAGLRSAEVSGEVASYDTFKGRFTYGNQFKNGLGMLMSGTLFDSEGPEYGEVRRADDDHYGSFFGTLSYHDLTLQGGYISRDKANPTGQYGTIPYDPRFSTVDERAYANLRYRHEFEADAEVMAQVYYDANDSVSQLPRQGVMRPYTSDLSGDWWGAEVQFTKRWLDRHTLIAGAEYRNDFQQNWQYYTDPAQPASLEYDRTAENYGVYLQGDVGILTNRQNLHLSAGARYDQYEDVDATVNPRVALIYNPIGETVFKAICGTAFRAPSFYELALAGPEGLDPETITTYELVYSQGLGKNLQASVAGFYNDIDDLITFDQGRQMNLDAARARGVEVALSAFWKDRIQGRVSYTYQDVEDVATGRTLTDAPRHLGKVNLTIPVLRKRPDLYLGVEWQFVSDRGTVSSTDQGGTIPGPDAKAYNLVNLTLFSQELVKGLDLSASVYNLLDEDYGDPATPQHLQPMIRQAGRTFRVKLTYRF